MNEISRGGAMALLAASAAARPFSAAAQTGTKIRMGAGVGDTLSEPYYGLESGAFDRAGVSKAGCA